MSTLTKPYGFTGGQFAVASQVNADFDTIYSWINGGGGVWADGSAAFTGIPSGPSSDPVSANQLTRKAYVDNQKVLCINGTTYGPGSPLRIVANSQVVTYTTGGVTVPFSIGFNVLPVVVANVLTSVGAATPDLLSTTTTNFKIGCYIGGSQIANGSSITVTYIAVGD